MAFWTNFFRKRRMNKQERQTDDQYLHSLDVIKESTEIYLQLLARYRQANDIVAIMRLEKKLNSVFEYSSKGWDGQISVVQTITSTCSVVPLGKQLRLE